MIWEKSSSLNCQEDNITSLENVHRWIVLSLAIVVPGQNVHRWIVVMWTFPRKHVHRWTYETKVVTSLGKNVQRWMWDIHIPPKHVHRWTLWDQSCHLAIGKNVQRWIHEIWTYGHRNMFIAEPRPMRPKLSPQEPKMFNAECEMHMHMVTYRNMFIAEPMSTTTSLR